MRPAQKTYIRIIKRPMDFLLALMLLLLFSPIILVTTVLLALANKGAGVFFTQERPGLHGKVFRVYKFKSMTDEKDESGKLLPDARRLTPVGKLVRSLSLDELPQLLNILKGDMSFIGPRPWRVEYLSLYTSEQMHRHDVLPGISGWAQVNGRNTISFTERIRYDLYYVEHISLLMDLRILSRTVLNVLRRKDISEAGHATSEAFNGKN